MPELPEVETIRRDLSAKIVGRKIISAKVLDSKLSQRGKLAQFLVGNKIVSAQRIGKLLIFELADKNFLLVHLKMTGQLVYADGDEIVAGGHPFKEGSILNKVGGALPNKHTRFWISFSPTGKDDIGNLFFNDIRRFGYVKVVSSSELAKIKNDYGIEPLTGVFTFDNLSQAISGRKIAIKALLLNQKIISGIGNIYADEILFAAGIKPDRQALSLKEKELKNILKETERIIALAVKHRGTTFSDYVDGQGRRGGFSAFLKVYGREGEKCLKCGRKISKKRVAGRGTHFCAFCQK
jgi:formamidopyrimidine-DNA glycosylase